MLNANDHFHPLAKEAWQEILSSDSLVFSSNYVLLETTALLQHRFGIDALRLMETSILPVVEIIWVDEAVHRQGMSALLAANRLHLSLVDCTSFEIIRQVGLDSAFTFDAHFGQQGIRIIPNS